MLKHVTDADFDREVLSQNRAVLVDFWAGWCGPCKAMSPTLEALAGTYDGILDIAKINVDENTNASDRFGVSGLPTLALFKDGREVARLLGLQSRTKLSAFLDAHLGRVAKDDVAARPVPVKAFGGEAATKAACISRMEAFLRGEPADGSYTLPLCAASGEQTPEAAAGVLGIPEALVPAVDILSTYYGTAAAGNAYVLSWLKSVPVGADLTTVPHDLLLTILNSPDMSDVLTEDAELAALQQHLITIHRQDPDFREWSRLRETLGRRIISLTGPLRAAGKCLQTACWPVTNPEILVETIRSAAFIPAARISREMGWTKQDQKQADTLLKQSAETLIAEKGTPKDALDLVARDQPEFAERYSRHSNRYFGAMRTFGQFVGTTLMTYTQALAD